MNLQIIKHSLRTIITVLRRDTPRSTVFDQNNQFKVIVIPLTMNDKSYTWHCCAIIFIVNNKSTSFTWWNHLRDMVPYLYWIGKNGSFGGFYVIFIISALKMLSVTIVISMYVMLITLSIYIFKACRFQNPQEIPKYHQNLIFVSHNGIACGI